MTATAPTIRYTARDFATLKDALSSYIRATYPELWTDFFESNLGVVLVDVVAYVGDILSFSIDRVAQEVFAATCKRYSSILRFAASVGYRPSGPTPASVDLKATAYTVLNPLPAQLTVAKGTRVNSGSHSYETLEDHVFPLGTTDVVFGVVEGSETSDSFIGTGLPNQSFDSISGPVAEESWTVLVNGVQWTEVESLLVHPGENVYQLIYLENQKIRILFGDGVYGNMPADGDNVVIVYRVTAGKDGEIAGYTIGQKITAILGTTPTQIDVVNPNASTGAANRETLAHVKHYIPRWIKTVDKAVTKADYDTLAATYSGPAGTIAKATALLRDSGTGPRVYDVLATYSDLPDGTPGDPYPPIGTLYVVQDLDGLAPSGPGLYRWTGATWGYVTTPAYLAANVVDIYVWAPTGVTFGNASTALKAALEAYLLERSLITVRISVKDGTTTPVDIDLGTVYINPAYDLVESRQEVLDALTDFFRREAHGPGSPIYLSDLYEVVNDVDAVDRFTGIVAPTGDVLAGDSELLIFGVFTATFEVTPEPTPTITGTCP